MHDAYTCPCLICEACNTFTWTWILLQWIRGTPNTNNLHLDSCSLNPFVEIGLRFIRVAFSPFCDFTLLPPNCSFTTLPLEDLDEVQRCSELLHRDGFVIIFVGFFFVLIFTKSITYHPRPTDVFCDTSLQYASSTCDPYWDKSHPDYCNEPELNHVWYWTSQPILSTTKLSLIPHVLRLCRWKNNYIL